MKITTRGRYGLRAMIALARCYGGPPLLMQALADGEGLSRKYLHALLASLKAAGLVQGTRGAGGGFVLSRSPAEIRLDEILRAVEGPLSLVACVAKARHCKRSEGCTARLVWQKLSLAVERVLNNVTLQELIELEQPAREATPGSGKKGSQASRKRPVR